MAGSVRWRNIQCINLDQHGAHKLRTAPALSFSRRRGPCSPCFTVSSDSARMPVSMVFHVCIRDLRKKGSNSLVGVGMVGRLGYLSLSDLWGVTDGNGKWGECHIQIYFGTDVGKRGAEGTKN